MHISAKSCNNAVVAFGSNQSRESRITNIEAALKRMEVKGLRVTKLSHLYETKPMYYDEQDPFLNGVCQVETILQPLELLDVLQEIELSLGRERRIPKGPRTIDLDILLYNNEHITNERLEVPHKLMLEREFVLRPLCDILPDQLLPPTFSPDTANRTIRQHLNDLTPKDPFMSSVTVLHDRPDHGSDGLIRSNDPNRKTLLMGIINATPDSFSNTNGNTGVVLSGETGQELDRLIADGVDIIDIGGQSTRPGATLIGAQEELERVLPWITAIRKREDSSSILISVDTFYSYVAKESIRAGADLINDVSAGMLDDDMLAAVAELGCTVVLMHMRGNPQNMTKLTDYPDGVVKGVHQELAQRVKAATAAGIPPWRIILDPGVGFAKDEAQNLELLRSLQEFRAASPGGGDDLSGFSWLVGTSRKGFIGKITNVNQPDKRQFGTAAAVTTSIAGGAEIVRVHDTREMAQVIKMADAVYRQRDSSFGEKLTKAAKP